MSTRNTIWTIILVIIAIVIAWWLVGILFSAIAFIFRLIIVAAVAALVYFGLRSFLSE